MSVVCVSVRIQCVFGCVYVQGLENVSYQDSVRIQWTGGTSNPDLGIVQPPGHIRPFRTGLREVSGEFTIKRKSLYKKNKN